METIIDLGNGSKYIVRNGRIGDTIIGELAHKMMWAMCRRFGYTTEVSYQDRIKFIEEYKTKSL